MSGRDRAVLAGILLAFVAAYGGLSVMAGGLYLDTHEGDSYHFLDVLIRMAERGQVPHLDFMTPLGILAFWPIVLWMKLGVPAGMATILAQVALALALLPIVVYAAATRMTRGVGLLFGCFTLGLVLALSYGGPYSGVTISMHYNRWAWGVGFVMLALALLPVARPRPGLDGALVGLLGAVLLLLKVTYFVTLVPVAALALARILGLRSILAALLAGAAVMLAVTLAFGPGFWFAYLADLRLVAGSDVRPNVGVPLGGVAASPAYLGATILGVATILLVRRAGPEAIGTCLALLVPGFVYITYQNFGNDPQWLLFLPVLLLALRPAEGTGDVFGIDLRRAMGTTAALAVAVFFPSLVNIALSPVNQLAFDKARFLPMIPEAAGHQDIFIRRDRAYSMTAQVFRDREPGPWARYAEVVGRPEEQEFGGVAFPHCEWMAGSRALFEVLSADLERSGIPSGSRLFTADILAALWLFGPWEPTEQAAPWYYGGLTGVQNADFILIPKCAFVGRIRQVVIDELNASGPAVTLERDTDLYALFRVGVGEARISLSR